MHNSRRLLMAVSSLAALALITSACASDSAATDPPPTEAVEHEDEHMDEMDHDMEEMDHDMEGMEHDAAAHGVPEDAAARPNPFAGDEAKTEEGAELFTTNCATCHGPEGRGDGPAAAGLEKQPADLHESHVQGLSDGALFYIVTNGRPDTPMPAWETVLDEDQRWAVVNFLRTFKEPSG